MAKSSHAGSDNTDCTATPADTDGDLPGEAEATQHTVDEEHQLAEDDVRLYAAESTVKGHVIAAMGLALVPLPLFDLAAVSGVQLKMISALARHYEVAFSQHLARSLVTALLGGALPVTATVTASSLLKLFPGIGHLAGGASVSVLAGATTYAVGQVFIQHFDSGGTLLDFDPEAVRGMFREKLRDGKAVARDLAEEQVTTG